MPKTGSLACLSLCRLLVSGQPTARWRGVVLAIRRRLSPEARVAAAEALAGLVHYCAAPLELRWLPGRRGNGRQRVTSECNACIWNCCWRCFFFVFFFLVWPAAVSQTTQGCGGSYRALLHHAAPGRAVGRCLGEPQRGKITGGILQGRPVLRFFLRRQGAMVSWDIGSLGQLGCSGGSQSCPQGVRYGRSWQFE